MTQKLRHAIDYVVKNVNLLSDDEYQSFMDDLVINLDVDLYEPDEERDF